MAFAAYARQFYDALERNAIISSLYLGMSLTGLESKSFGRRPTSSVNQMTVPIHRIEDPLKVPKEPLQISRSDLRDSSSLGQQATELIARAFRAGNLYYSPH